MIKEEARRILMDLLIAYDNYEHGDYFYDYGNEVCEAVECLLSKSDVPEVHGRWTKGIKKVGAVTMDVYYCSKCSNLVLKKLNYCHDCGAKMDLEADGDVE